MTEQEWIRGYKTEIHYQEHMIENLGRWFSLFFTLTTVGLVLVYFFHQTNLFAMIAGVLFAILGGLAMLVFGYGIYRGRLNLQKVIDDFNEKLQLADR